MCLFGSGNDDDNNNDNDNNDDNNDNDSDNDNDNDGDMDIKPFSKNALVAILDHCVSLTLLYKLSIVWEILSSSSQACQQWAVQFLSIGGITHLIHITMNSINNNPKRSSDCVKNKTAATHTYSSYSNSQELHSYALLYRVIVCYLHLTPRNHFFSTRYLCMYINTYTHTHTHTHIYIYIYICIQTLIYLVFYV